MGFEKVIWLDQEQQQKRQKSSTPFWDKAFIKQHDVSGPRYTSYPTALQFQEDFSLAHYNQAVDQSKQEKKALSLYLHLPFCESLCYYCACNKIITQKTASMRDYLDQLLVELSLRAEDFGEDQLVHQMHWGGGTPTYFDAPELTELMYHIGRHFNLVEPSKGDFSIEIDPRTVDVDKLSLLRGLGFNRVSLGIQDFDQAVQQAVNREQSFASIRDMVADIRALKYSSLNFDLIYGLPKQTVASVSTTINKVIELDPDRISLFNYAHLPHRFKAQGLMDAESLPCAAEKLDILCLAAESLVNAGYIYIGMDHFAKPDDALSQAWKNGQLQRNFQGYTPYLDADLVGLGVSAISQVGNTISQNTGSIKEYQALLQTSTLPIKYGLTVQAEDALRRDIIMSLLCQNSLDIEVLEQKHGIVFADKFAKEVIELAELEQQGLLVWQPGRLLVTEPGRLVVRRICMVFDQYLSGDVSKDKRFSRIL